LTHFFLNLSSGLFILTFCLQVRIVGGSAGLFFDLSLYLMNLAFDLIDSAVFSHGVLLNIPYSVKALPKIALKAFEPYTGVGVKTGGTAA